MKLVRTEEEIRERSELDAQSARLYDRHGKLKWSGESLVASLSRKPGRPPGTTKPGLLAPSREELDRFFRAIRKARDAQADLAFGLALYFGLRVSELSALKLTDVQDGGGPGDLAITVRGLKKGEQRRYANLDGRLVYKVRKWIRDQRRAAEGNAYLFPSKMYHDRPLSAQAFKDAFKKYAREAGLPSSYSVHGLRHACAVTMILAGASAPEVQHWMRLRCIANAQVYFDKMNFAATDKKAPGIFSAFM